MREYQRTSRECAFSDLATEQTEAFRKYAEKNNLGDFEAEILICCETQAMRIKKPGFFGKIFGGGNSNYAEKTIALVTPERLIWCTLDTRGNAVVSSALLAEIEVKDYASELIEDSGVEIFGFINQSAERGTVFIGLGEADAAGEKFRHVLKEAAKNAGI